MEFDAIYQELITGEEKLALVGLPQNEVENKGKP